MDYPEFRRRFGASVRRKHIRKPGLPFFNNKVRKNKKPYGLPATSEIALDFIRLDPWEAEYLFILAQRARLGVVETGRFYGGSTFLMACANDHAPIHSIDIAPQDDARLAGFFDKFDIGRNVNLIVGDSRKTRYPEIKTFDLLFIDGDHSYEGCTDDLENWFPLLEPGGHLVLHDSYHGSPVMEAVEDFRRRHAVDAIVPPLRPSTHWDHYAGSLAHLVKR